MSVATQQRPGCAAVHLRHIRKTGGGSVRHVLFKLGYRRARIFGSNDEKTAYKRELDLLSTSRHFFDEHQAGKRVFYEQVGEARIEDRYAIATDAMVRMFGSQAWQAHMHAFLNRKRR